MSRIPVIDGALTRFAKDEAMREMDKIKAMHRRVGERGQALEKHKAERAAKNARRLARLGRHAGP